MKMVLSNLFNIHEALGKIFTFLCVSLVIFAFIGFIFGKTRFKKYDEVNQVKYFFR